MIDESVVKRLAVQCGAMILGGAFVMDFEEMVVFANAIAAHQCEKVSFSIKEEFYAYKNHTSDELFVDTAIELVDSVVKLANE